MSTIKCPKCKEEIQQDATKCKHCGSSLSNWFSRHKVWTGIIVLLLIVLIVKAFEPKTTIVNTEPVKETKPTPFEEKEVSKITKANCDLIKAGMTPEEVKGILGEPTFSSESDIEGYGKTEYWVFQEGFKQDCSVNLDNGKVSSKSWSVY